MRQEVIFDTEAELEVKQAMDHMCNIEYKRDTDFNADWEAKTTSWDIGRERLDGKFAYDICPHADYTDYTVEDYDAANYPQPIEFAN